MAKFKCKLCGYTTEEFEELPEDFKCPMCGATADMFEKVEQVIQMAYVCKVCGFVLEEDELPEDYVCPVCGVPAANFEEQQVLQFLNFFQKLFIFKINTYFFRVFFEYFFYISVVF